MAKAKILGKLKGIIASARESSRNGRKYTEDFWDKKFNSDLFKEGLENRVFAAACYHPDDEEEYSQIHLDDRAAVILTDVKKQGLDYIGTFDILPTQAGQCVRNLLDVGVVFGVSSRGLADYDTAVYDSNFADNYDLITFDLVAFPGVKSCRLHEVGAVAESFKTKKSKERIMENLSVLTAENPELKNYVDNALKAKEDFDNDLQVEDVMAKYNIPDDMKEFANIVTVDENGSAWFDDGVHGKATVDHSKRFEIPTEGKYLVDDIYYDEYVGEYITVGGDWLKL